MKFRDQLNKAKEIGIIVGELNVANECDAVFEFKYTDKEFEQLCDFVYYCWLKDCSGNITPYHLAQAVNELIKEDEKTIDEVTDMSKWDMLEKACEYTY